MASATLVWRRFWNRQCPPKRSRAGLKWFCQKLEASSGVAGPIGLVVVVVVGGGGGGGIEPRARLSEPCHGARSEEHTSELQSLMRISYAVFCLKKKKKADNNI